MNQEQNGYVLEVNGLNIYYGNFQAVEDVSFSVKPGEIFGLLGPNGAGKTSTLSAIEGLLKPRSGSIIVAGCNCNSPVSSQSLKSGKSYSSMRVFMELICLRKK